MGERDTTLICIVDDDASVRRSVGNLLRSIGFVVAAFPSAEAFLTSPQCGISACLVLDLTMPGGLGGLDLLARLKAEASTIPVIILTARPGPGTRDQCLAAGATGFLTKPFQPDVLTEAIKAAIG